MKPKIHDPQFEEAADQRSKIDESEEGNSGSMEDFLFDDCPICTAQKDALLSGRKLTQAELHDAFKKANRK